MKSKTKIKKQTEKKNNPELVETVLAANKKESWAEVARILSSSRKLRVTKNLNDLEKETAKILVVPGKVLSDGEIKKKVKIVALNFSGKAKEKLLKAGCDVKSILDEIKSNPEAKDIKLLRK